MTVETKEFSKKVLEKLGGEGKSCYYVYRLIDPRNYETFYVGKGCRNRVFQHANGVIKMDNRNEESNEDEETLKIRQIREILADGKEVITMIHRWNLTEQEAFEVEAALIDCYPGLTNIQSGHGSDYGVVSTDDLMLKLGAEEYDEPQEDYVIIKTTEAFVCDRGSLYDAVRRAWKAKLDKAKNYKYVLGVINGMVREVYEVSEWKECASGSGRIEFIGEPAKEPMSRLKKKLIPYYYKKRGASNPFIYKKEKEQ